ncbi:MAG: AAA family ATPase [Vicinamibacteria bacterium]
MYERHFGFTEKPFNLTPDFRYLFLSSGHQAALANLASGVRERSGCLLLTGEVGTGKTTLIRHFLSQTGPDVRAAVVLNPALSAGEMFHAILQDLEIPFHGGTLKDAMDTLANALIAAKARDLKVVVLIDEAQNLNPRVLEQFRLMSNLETERDKLLTLVLVGEPALRGLLDQPSLRQLSQRITSRSHLEPLSLDETRGYIKHRLVVAGGSGAAIDDPAIRRIYEFSKGVPRNINVLCDRALVGAFGEGKTVVDERLVDAAAAELLPSNQTKPLMGGRWSPALGLFSLGLMLVLLLRFCASPPSPVPVKVTPAPASVALPSASLEITPILLGPGTSSQVPAQAAPAAGVRCVSSLKSRAAAIAGMERVLGTPGFDTAQATLTFDQWKALKLPAIARFQGASGPCEVGIVPVDAASTSITDDTGVYVMPNAKLVDSYLGSAILGFVDRESVLAKSESARLVWAREMLEKNKLVGARASDAAFHEALSRLASSVGLENKNTTSVDGVLLAALYALDGGQLKGTGQ